MGKSITCSQLLFHRILRVINYIWELIMLGYWHSKVAGKRTISNGKRDVFNMHSDVKDMHSLKFIFLFKNVKESFTSVTICLYLFLSRQDVQKLNYEGKMFIIHLMFNEVCVMICCLLWNFWVVCFCFPPINTNFHC